MTDWPSWRRTLSDTLLMVIAGVCIGVLLAGLFSSSSASHPAAGPPIASPSPTVTPTLPRPEDRSCRPVKIRLVCNEYWIAVGYQRAGNYRDHARVVRLYEQWKRDQRKANR